MAQFRFALVFLACAASVLDRTVAHSSGAPEGACSTLTPQHEAATSVPGGQPPYVLSAPQSVAAGSKTIVTVGGAPFKGFIVRAMDASGSGGQARFLGGGPGARYQAITCDASGDTATHTDSSDKDAIKLEWQAPTVPGMYRLVATIVKDYSTFHTGYYTDVLVQ